MKCTTWLHCVSRDIWYQHTLQLALLVQLYAVHLSTFHIFQHVKRNLLSVTEILYNLASMLHRYHEDDQINLEHLIAQWSSDNQFYLRKCDDLAKLLFIHQTSNQKRLLSRYGSELTCLDATYKTTHYALPLFFLVVKTNVDYQVSFWSIL